MKQHTEFLEKQDGIASVLVSLYLVILAFFILLVSISHIKEERRKVAIGSIQKTFVKGKSGSSMNLINDNGKEKYAALRPSFGRIAKLTRQPIRISDVDIIHDGDTMKLMFTKKSFFEDFSREVRASKAFFLEILSKELASNPPGMEIDVEILVPTEKFDEEPNAVNSIAIGRSGNVARILREFEVDPRTIFIKADLSRNKEYNKYFSLNFTERSNEDKQKF